MYGREGGAYRALVEAFEGMRPLGRPRRRGEVNIKMEPQGVERRGRDYSGLAQNRDIWRVLVNAVMNVWVP
jgi:hypothetical protein